MQRVGLLTCDSGPERAIFFIVSELTALTIAANLLDYEENNIINR